MHKFIPMAIPSFDIQEKRILNECLDSTWISSAGPYIDKFEQAFAQKFNVKHAISCSNGTSALHLALLALDIKKGDEIIIPALTFVSTANVVVYTGATAVFVDIDPLTWNIDASKIEAKITKNTKAIIPVHLYGYPCDLSAILRIAYKYGLAVIEDAAEAHGAIYKNKYVGTLGDIGCFSFYGNKIITTGEGGMLILKSSRLAQKIRLFKNHGMSQIRRYWHPVVGYNYRMTNLQAAIGLTQLDKIEIFLKKRTLIKKWYIQRLSSVPGLYMPPSDTTNSKSVNWLFTMRVTGKKTRDQLIQFLKKKNVDSRPAFYPVTDFPMYKTGEEFPVAQKITHEAINLPTFVDLTKEQVNYITKMIRSYISL